jgi:tellurite methyltransferase
MTDAQAVNPPSAFIERFIRRLAASGKARGARALAVACGSGRHGVPLAAAGFAVTAIDIQYDLLVRARTSAAGRGLRLSLACADLTMMPLPPRHFDVVVVTRYLDRRLFPSLRDTLVPGGLLLYETFTEHQRRYARGPRSRDHLLAPGELRMLVRGMEVLFDEEVVEPEAVARIAAKRRDATASRES